MTATDQISIVPTPENTYSDLSLKEVPWSIGGKDYLLREASEGAATIYRNKNLEGARFKDGQMVQVGPVAEMQPLLVSLCLLQKGSITDRQGNSADTWVPVALEVIKRWPSKLVKKLFAQARDISDLGEEETEESLTKRIAADQEKLRALREGKSAAKNGQPSMTDSSDTV